MGATRRIEGRLQRKERPVEIKRSLSYPKGGATDQDREEETD